MCVYGARKDLDDGLRSPRPYGNGRACGGGHDKLAPNNNMAIGRCEALFFPSCRGRLFFCGLLCFSAFVVGVCFFSIDYITRHAINAVIHAVVIKP